MTQKFQHDPVNSNETQGSQRPRIIDKTIEDSFPASDPPSWSGSTIKKNTPSDA